MSAPHIQHCMDLVRQHDYHRYLANLYLPPRAREAAFAIYAFNVEVSKIGALVSEPMAGEIRLQWWRDIIADKGDASGSPVAIALVQTIRMHALPVDVFDRLLEARIFDLYSDPMPDLNSFEGYMGETRSVLFQLVLQACQQTQVLSQYDKLISNACGHGGVCLGVIELLEQLPIHEHQKKSFFPAEAFTGLRISAQSDIKNTGEINSDWLGAVCEYATEHYLNAGENVNQLPEELRTVFLPLATIRAQIENITKRGVDLKKPVSSISQIKAWWIIRNTARRGTF